MVTVKEIESFMDYGKCVSISNGVIEAYVTVDIGPRIIKFGYVDGQNFMCTEREALGGRGDKAFEDYFGKGRKWENLGGHRIWLSPESYPETYLPDDRPVSYTVTEHGAVFNPFEDTEVGVQKTLEIKMDKDDAFLILNDVGIKDNIEETYAKLISNDVYYDLYKKGKIDENDSELIIKYEIYDTENLFKNKNTSQKNEANFNEETSLVEKKDKNFIQKLFEKIKYLFRRK